MKVQKLLFVDLEIDDDAYENYSVDISENDFSEMLDLFIKLNDLQEAINKKGVYELYTKDGKLLYQVPLGNVNGCLRMEVREFETE